jgi:hypothetical protein
MNLHYRLGQCPTRSVLHTRNSVRKKLGILLSLAGQPVVAKAMQLDLGSLSIESMFVFGTCHMLHRLSSFTVNMFPTPRREVFLAQRRTTSVHTHAAYTFIHPVLHLTSMALLTAFRRAHLRLSH